MALLKCEMCGADLNVDKGRGVIKCEYCGSVQTIPEVGDEKTAPLLKRAYLLLEDGDWNNANRCCEEVLDIDPENAQAYLFKLMADLHVNKQENLRNVTDVFDSNNNYKKVMRFGNEEMKNVVTGYVESIRKQNQEKNDKKKRALPLWATICIVVLAAAVVTLGVLMGIDRYNNPPVPTEPTVNFDSYTGEEKELISIRDRVVATVGDKELTSAKLQVYYWITVYSFLDENSYYLSLMGFDYTKDFATQECYFEKGISWQEYFLKNTLSTWHQYTALNLEAQKNDFKLNEEEQKYLDDFRETMDKQAKLYGYADAQEMITEELGVGASFDAYVEYTKETFIGMGYYNQFAEGLEITEDDILCYYQDNEATFEENKIKKDDTDFAWVGVRHILICPEKTKDANGKEIVTEEAWETCRKKAQALLDSFLAGKEVTEEVFAELAKQYTEDPGSKNNGGLYDQFFRNEMVAEFETWSFDATRKYGDTGLVKTSYGYHIMYFIEGEAQWHYYADAQLRSDACKEFLEGLEKNYPLSVDYDKILLGHVQLS